MQGHSFVHLQQGLAARTLMRRRPSFSAARAEVLPMQAMDMPCVASSPTICTQALHAQGWKQGVGQEVMQGCCCRSSGRCGKGRGQHRHSHMQGRGSLDG